MPLPANWNTVAVAATYLKSDGSAATGSVQFKAVRAVGMDDTIVLPNPITAVLNGSGTIAVNLPCPDDAGAGYTTLVYEVIERVAKGRDRYFIEIDNAMVSVDLEDAPRVAPLNEDQEYVAAAKEHALSASADALAASAGAATATAQAVVATTKADESTVSAAAADASADAAAVSQGVASSAAASATASASTAESVAGPTYANQATGEAATAAGESFAVDNGDGTVSVYLRTLGGSTLQRKLATTAALAASSGAALVWYMQSGTGAVARTLEDKARENATIQDFGGVADGVTSIHEAIDFARTSGVRRLRLPAGNYTASSTLDVGDMLVEGDGAATVITASGGFVGNCLFESTGSLTQIQELGANAAIGTNTVTFASPPSLVVGDVFVIYNPTDSSWSGYRTNYRAGEWCEVASIAGSVVKLKSPLYDSYVVAAVDVYKLNAKRPTIRNMKVAGNSLGLASFSLCDRPLVENVTGSHGNNSVINFDRCFRPTVINPQMDNSGDGGDDYGIAIGNSQHARIIGGSLFSRRHATATGGNAEIGCVPVRDARISHAVIKNDPASNTHAADFHGNADDCSYDNCTIYGGCSAQGKDVYYKDCTIYAIPSLGVCAYAAEVLGGTHGFHRCRFVTSLDPSAVSRGVIDFGGNTNAMDANMRFPLTVEVLDCTVVGRNFSAATSIVKVVNRGATQAINVNIDGLRLDVNNMTAVLFTQLVSGTAASDFIIVDRIYAPANANLHTASGSAYLNFPHRLMRQTGKWSGVSTVATFANSPTINLRYRYPRVPSAFASLQPDDTAVQDLVGGQTASPRVYQCTTQALRLRINTAANMTAGTAFAIPWAVEIREC